MELYNVIELHFFQNEHSLLDYKPTIPVNYNVVFLAA